MVKFKLCNHFLYSKIKYKKTQLMLSYILNGASDGNRTHVLALARPRTSRCTTPAYIWRGQPDLNRRSWSCSPMPYQLGYSPKIINIKSITNSV